ncbi:membrane protein implicated in regulation of membrane protease activity [Azospirillum lipoferum]|uniref:NfeD family protein n=1 Tax=Azospirillum lipoferum TaxID=193 RepID=A0A5A9GW10_AZOLI|nr:MULTISPECIES: NfeD family protein [Azospirillum]KAA0598637.1 NfeD family protein [Azospirillum lipoferum]MCP1609343.1 membrane protein implicated in regulation of membrane protease activity [Azospirillum lipoferum]MDW5535348.1 NfeD family protein [Azospirillum sp. NL1]
MSPLLWGALGAVLIAAELVIPGLFLIWFGGAALLTGLVTALWHDWGLVNEAGFFTIAAGAAVAAAMIHARRRNASAESDAAQINDRAGQLVGRAVTLSEPIVNGQGRVFVGDTLWAVEGPDRPAGAAMLVAGHKGMVLVVRDAAQER